MSRQGVIPLLWLSVCGLGVTASRLAHAQNPAAAEALFEQARAAMSAGSFDIACARFRDSDKLDPAVGTRFNLADCEERRGHVATAWSLFRGVLSELADDDDRKPIAQRRASALEPRLSYLTLRRVADTPASVHVRIDGVELGEASFGVALPMDPGAHDWVLTRAEGKDSEHRSFALREGERRDLPLHLDATGPSARADETAPAPASGASDDSRRRWAYVAGGVGAAGVVFAAVTGIVTLNKKSTADANCSDQRRLCNQVGIEANEAGKTYGALSALGFGVGVVGLATGAYLWLTAPKAATHTAHSSIPVRRAFRVSPELACANGTGFLGVSGSF